MNKESNNVIGDVGVHFMDDENLQSEVGCTLSKAYHGQGFATEAIAATLDVLFMELNKHRLMASIDPQNLSSIKLVERLGLRKEGHFKESLLVKGEWVDDVIYAVLRKEWIERRSAMQV